MPLVEGVSSSRIRELCRTGTSPRQRGCSAARPSSRAPSSPATSAAARSASRPRTSPIPTRPARSRHGIYAGAALGHRVGPLDRRQSALRRASSGGSRRSCSTSRATSTAAAPARALGAAPRRAGVRERAGARGADRPRRRAGAAGAPVAQGVAGLRSRLGSSRVMTDSSGSSRVRCLACGNAVREARGRRTVSRTPAAPSAATSAGFPDETELTAAQRPLRSAADLRPPRSARHAHPAEVVVRRRPAPHLVARSASSAATASSREAGLDVHDVAGRVEPRPVDGGLRRRGPRRGCRRAPGRARFAGDFRRPSRRRARGRRRRPRRSAPSCSASARRARAARRAARTSPSMLFRWTSRPGRKSPEPSPRLVVSDAGVPLARRRR